MWKVLGAEGSFKRSLFMICLEELQNGVGLVKKPLQSLGVKLGSVESLLSVH